MPDRRPAILIRLACLAAVLLAAAAPARAQVIEKEPPAAIRGLDIVEHLGRRIPLDLDFNDAQGRPVKLSKYFNNGKPVVLAMVYFRCPMQCPTVISRLNRRLNELDLTIGDQFNVLIVSFDPTEGPDAAGRQKVLAVTGYERRHPESLESSWEFLTSQGDSARRLADALGFPYRYLPESNEYSHATVAFVLTPEGAISRYLYGIDYPTDRLKMALVEAAGGRIGSSWDRIILWCFHYDPQAGAYTIAAVRIMRIGGAATAIGLGALLFSVWRRGRL